MEHVLKLPPAGEGGGLGFIVLGAGVHALSPVREQCVEHHSALRGPNIYQYQYDGDNLQVSNLNRFLTSVCTPPLSKYLQN